ncbi:MAG: type II secretion system secretin GspD [Rhizomicrobium sp.]
MRVAIVMAGMLLFGGAQAQVGPPVGPQNGPVMNAPGASGPPQAIAPAAGNAGALPGPIHHPISRRHLKGVSRADEAKDVTLNFPGVDVHEAAKAILGDILGLNYAVDPSVSGAITVVTANPVRKSDVFPLLEDSLKAANLGLVKRGAVYTIVPLPEAKRQPQLVGPDDPGYGTEAIQLHYVGASEIKKLLEPLVPENAISQIDPGRNIVLVTGSAGERSSIRALVQQFDVNWLQGMSFAMFIPKHTDIKQIQPQLDQLLNGDGAPTAGLVKLLPVDRINGILAISKQPQYLKDVGRWVEMLDRESEEGSKRLFVYRVQNGKASDLALVLANAFGASGNANNGQQGTPNKYANGLNRPPPVGTFQPQGGGSNPMVGSQASGGSSPFDHIGAANSDALGGEAPMVAGTSIQLSASGSPVTLTSDDSNNAIVVYASAREYGIIEDALKKLDTQPLQVMIEAAIAEVTLTNQMQYGVQWAFGAGAGSANLSQAQGASSNAVTGVSTLPGFSYLLTYGATINATLNALAGVTKLDVLSAPKLVVLNNHTAALEVGQQVPISTGSAVSTESSSAPIVNSVDYRDTGVILKVTPRVNDGGLVLLDISQEVSDVASTTSSQIDSPTINERKIASSIAVHDGQTVALGGLITRSKTDNSLGIPLLRHIPVLGPVIFNSTDKEDDRTELIVLLTPRVIRSDVEAKSVTDSLLQAMKSIQPLVDKKNQ